MRVVAACARCSRSRRSLEAGGIYRCRPKAGSRRRWSSSHSRPSLQLSRCHWSQALASDTRRHSRLTSLDGRKIVAARQLRRRSEGRRNSWTNDRSVRRTD